MKEQVTVVFQNIVILSEIEADLKLEVKCDDNEYDKITCLHRRNLR